MTTIADIRRPMQIYAKGNRLGLITWRNGFFDCPLFRHRAVDDDSIYTAAYRNGKNLAERDELRLPYEDCFYLIEGLRDGIDEFTTVIRIHCGCWLIGQYRTPHPPVNVNTQMTWYFPPVQLEGDDPSAMLNLIEDMGHPEPYQMTADYAEYARQHYPEISPAFMEIATANRVQTWRAGGLAWGLVMTALIAMPPDVVEREARRLTRQQRRRRAERQGQAVAQETIIRVNRARLARHIAQHHPGPPRRSHDRRGHIRVLYRGTEREKRIWVRSCKIRGGAEVRQNYRLRV